MASATIVLPNGQKVRSQSQRRYIVVRVSDRFDPAIVYRTDDVARAVNRQHKDGRTTHVVIDTVTQVVAS